MRRAFKKGIQKQNNKGLSLVEVLVAVIIMSVVSIVFLQSFSYSMMLNKDAKVDQDGLAFAQSLMEGIKAYNIDQLDTQFGSTSTDPIAIFDIGGGSHTKSVDGSGVRTYTIDNAVFENNLYDAEIKITPTSQKGNMVTIDDFNMYTDAFFIQDSLEQDGLIAEVQSKLSAEGYTGAWDASKVTITKRELTVTISNSGGGEKLTAKSVYTYKASGFTKTDPLNPMLPITIPDIVDTYEVTYESSQYDNQGKAPLENLYVYYYPAYGDPADGYIKCSSDIITVNNDSVGLEKIYVLKQAYSSWGVNDLKNAEDNYSAVCNVTSASAVDYYTNIHVCLEGTGSPGFSTGTWDNCSAPQLPWAEDTAETVLLYDVIVTVKDNETSEVVCELVGSTNAKRER